MQVPSKGLRTGGTDDKNLTKITTIQLLLAEKDLRGEIIPVKNRQHLQGYRIKRAIVSW